MVTLVHSPVHSDPEVLGGTLVFRGTRVPAQSLLDYMDDGVGLDELIGSFKFVFPGIGMGSHLQNRDFPSGKQGGFQIHGPATVPARNMRKQALLLRFHFPDCRL
jgi:hypothetical protein